MSSHTLSLIFGASIRNIVIQWGSYLVNVESIHPAANSGLEAWITSDGRAYCVYLYQDEQNGTSDGVMETYPGREDEDEKSVRRQGLIYSLDRSPNARSFEAIGGQ
jgi:hypothetical protein